VTADRDAFAVGPLRADASDADFAALYRAHYATVVLVMRRWLLPQDAEDAAQDAFLRAWRHWPPRHAETERWLYRIARNVLVDAVRQRQVAARQRLPMDYDFPPDADTDFASDGFEDAVLDALVVTETWQRLVTAWPSLTERQQAALLLWMDGAPSPDAAPLFGVTPVGFRRLVQRGQQTLQRMARR